MQRYESFPYKGNFRVIYFLYKGNFYAISFLYIGKNRISPQSFRIT